MKYFLFVMGMVMILWGLPFVAFPRRMKNWLHNILTAVYQAAWSSSSLR
jgi:hypothetical protein